MSRLAASVLLVVVFSLNSCGPTESVAALTAEEQAVAGTYVLTQANGKALPATIGTFINGGGGSVVTVKAGTLVLGPDSKTRSAARLNVTVEYLDSDPIQGVTRRNDDRETVAIWSLSGAMLSFQEGNPTFVMTTGSLSGRTATITNSGPGLYGAGSPTVVLTLTRQ